jgi:protein-tyrosine phosphatase
MRAGATSQPRNQFREIVVGQLNMNSLNYGLLENVFKVSEKPNVNFFKDYPHQGIIQPSNNSQMFPHAHEIIPHLWLGNRYAASNEDDFLLKHHITTVFNASKDIPFHDSVKMRYRIAVDDNLRPEEIANMTKWAPEIVYTVLKEYKEGKPILVHCAAGMQRSAAIVAMFLIAHKGMTADEAMQYIHKIRKIAFTPAANFEDSIRHFEYYYKNDLIPQILQQK